MKIVNANIQNITYNKYIKNFIKCVVVVYMKKVINYLHFVFALD